MKRLTDFKDYVQASEQNHTLGRERRELDRRIAELQCDTEAEFDVDAAARELVSPDTKTATKQRTAEAIEKLHRDRAVVLRARGLQAERLSAIRAQHARAESLAALPEYKRVAQEARDALRKFAKANERLIAISGGLASETLLDTNVLPLLGVNWLGREQDCNTRLGCFVASVQAVVGSA